MATTSTLASLLSGGSTGGTGRVLIGPQSGSKNRSVGNALLLRALQEQINARTPTAAWLKGADRTAKGLMGLYMAKKEKTLQADRDKNLRTALENFSAPTRQIQTGTEPVGISMKDVPFHTGMKSATGEDPAIPAIRPQTQDPPADWTSEDVRAVMEDDPTDTPQARQAAFINQIAQSHPEQAVNYRLWMAMNNAKAKKGSTANERLAGHLRQAMGMDDSPESMVESMRLARGTGDKQKFSNSIWRLVANDWTLSTQEQRAEKHASIMGLAYPGKKNAAAPPPGAAAPNPADLVGSPVTPSAAKDGDGWSILDHFKSVAGFGGKPAASAPTDNFADIPPNVKGMLFSAMQNAKSDAERAQIMARFDQQFRMPGAAQRIIAGMGTPGAVNTAPLPPPPPGPRPNTGAGSALKQGVSRLPKFGG